MDTDRRACAEELHTLAEVMAGRGWPEAHGARLYARAVGEGRVPLDRAWSQVCRYENLLD